MVAKGSKACRDCEVCTKSALGSGVYSTGRATLAVATLGTSTMVRGMQKKCRSCGHPLGKHTDQAPQVINNVVHMAPPPAPLQGPAPPPQQPMPALPAQAGDGGPSELFRLAEMRQAGLLTDEEFAAGKARILGTQQAPPPTPPPMPGAWYPDPAGRNEFRWFDGQRWTDNVTNGGASSIDPL